MSWLKQSERHRDASLKGWRLRRRNTRRALKIHHGRSKHAQNMDGHRSARKTLSLTKENIDIWSEHPGRMDLRGIDTGSIVRKVRIIKQEGVEKVRKKKAVVEKIEHIERKIRARKSVTRRYPVKHKLTGIEKRNLYKIADKYNVSRDLVDWEALTDSTLTYYENREILTDYISTIGRKTELDTDISQLEGQYADYVEELRWRSENLSSSEERLEAQQQLRAMI